MISQPRWGLSLLEGYSVSDGHAFSQSGVLERGGAASAYFAVESTATEKISTTGEISAKSSFHQPSFIVPALKTEHCQLNTLLSIQQAGTMKPRRGRQADPAAKRCRATRSPEGGS